MTFDDEGGKREPAPTSVHPQSASVADVESQAARSRRFTFIDSLRGIAAMSVVLFHAEQGQHIDGLLAKSPDALRVVLEHGNLGVEIFFVLRVRVCISRAG